MGRVVRTGYFRYHANNEASQAVSIRVTKSDGTGSEERDAIDERLAGRRYSHRIPLDNSRCSWPRTIEQP